MHVTPIAAVSPSPAANTAGAGGASAQLSLISRSLQAGGWWCPRGGARVEVSAEAAGVMGLGKPSSLSLLNALGLFGEPWRSQIVSACRHALQRRRPADLVVQARLPTGERRWIRLAAEVSRDAGGRSLGLLGFVQDVTEERQAEHQGAALAAMLGDTLDSISDAVFVVDRDWRFVAVNRAFEHMLGRTGQELTGQVAWDAFPGSRGSEFERRYRRAMSERVETTFQATYAPIGLRVEARAYPSPQGLTVYLRDITREHEAAEQLRLLRWCVDGLHDVVMITDAMVAPPGPRILFVNAAIERFCGYRADELVGRSPRLLQCEDTSRAELDRVRAALAAQRPVTARLLNRAKDGRQYWLEMAVTPIFDADGHCSHFLAIQRDVTEQMAAEGRERDLEAQLRQSQKMESIGTLAGGIAHDFNNILAAVLGHVEIARAAVEPGGAAEASLGQIRHASLRARSLVQQILAFSKRQTHQRAEHALMPIVGEAAGLLRATLPAGVKLELRLSQEPLIVAADPNQLEQVILNLCTNAWHSLEDQPGVVTVGVDGAGPPGADRLPPQVVDETAPSGSAALPYDRWAHLWVSDTGIGMDPATRARIFEPFFTTKVVGQGTGLGLPVVHGIVADHGGVISVDSEVGKGSTFHIHLPARLGRSATDAAEPPRVKRARLAPPRGQRILYVDDDEVMLLMMEPMLRQQGFVPTCEVDPGDAVARLTEDPNAFDVVVTDYNMPGLSGADVARAVRRLRADLPVILISGFVTQQQQEQAQAAGALGPINKQDGFEDLAELIDQVAARRD